METALAVYSRGNPIRSHANEDSLDLEDVSKGSLLRRKNYHLNRASALEITGNIAEASESMRKTLKVMEKLRQDHGYAIDEEEMRSLYEFCAVSFMDSGFGQMKEYGNEDERPGKAARCFRLAAELLEESLKYSSNLDTGKTRKMISYLHEGSAILYRVRAHQLSGKSESMTRMMYSCAIRQFGTAASFAIDDEKREKLLKEEKESRRERHNYLSSTSKPVVRRRISVPGIEDDMKTLLQGQHGHDFSQSEFDEITVNLTEEERARDSLESRFRFLMSKSDDHEARAYRIGNREDELAFSAYDSLMALRIVQTGNSDHLIDIGHYEKALGQFTEALLEFAELLEDKKDEHSSSKAKFIRSLIAKYNNILAFEYERIYRDNLRKGKIERANAYLEEAQHRRERFKSDSASRTFDHVFHIRDSS